MKKIAHLLLGRFSIVAVSIILQFLWLVMVMYQFSYQFTYANLAIRTIAIIVVLVIVNRWTNPANKLSWTFIILLSPVLGLLLYMIFGRSSLTKKTQERMDSVNREVSACLYQTPEIKEQLEREDLSVYRQSRYINDWAGFPLYHNTSTKYYSCGEEMVPDMLADLEKAKHFIFLEYFIVDQGVMFDRIVEVLEQKSKEGVDVSVLAVNTLGVLYIVENGDSVQSVADLKGKTIYASGKGATPEYALNYMLTANGIDPEKDVTIEYKSEHSECVAALAANEDAVAMLPQPFVTVAMTQNENIRVALDLTEEWEKSSADGDTKATLITGVVIARNDFIEAHPDAVETFLQQYEASVNYVNDNVAEAAVLVGNYDIVAAQVAEKAIPECNIAFIAGNDMKAKLSSYLGILFEQNPAAVGGALPNDDFYYNAD